MELVFYAYTIAVMLVCIVAATATLSAGIVTQNRQYLFGALAFFLYMLDLALIFQSEYLGHGQAIDTATLYSIEEPMLKALLAAGVLESLWVALLLYLDRLRPVLAAVPPVVFLAADFLIANLMPDGALRQWCFYSCREAFLLWVLGWLAYSYRTGAESMALRARIRRLKPFVAAGAVLVACIVLENTLVILVWDPSAQMMESLLPIYISERNLSENVLVIVYAAAAIYASLRALRLRRREPMGSYADDQERYIEQALGPYADEHGLTPREREVLRQMLDGKDYQNIASELHLAVGTVKSHAHNIFQKTGVKSRQELLQDFWE